MEEKKKPFIYQQVRRCSARSEDVMEIVAKRQKAQITQQMAFIWMEFCIEHRCVDPSETVNFYHCDRIHLVVEVPAVQRIAIFGGSIILSRIESRSRALHLSAGRAACVSRIEWKQMRYSSLNNNSTRTIKFHTHTHNRVNETGGKMARKDTGSMVRWWDKTVTISKMAK